MSASILVVDDERTIRFLVGELLRKEGFQVEEAQSGQDAIEKVKSGTYDLVISDMHMPAVSGLEVLRAAKSYNADTEVLILTGFGSISTAVEAMKHGAFEYLTKPIDTEEFLLRVHQSLERQQLRREIEEQREKIKAQQEVLARDLKLAEQVQQSLVPPAVSTEKVAIDVQYQPMLGVGGDYADIYFHSDSQLYLTLGDITGHGISAALLVNRISSEVRKLVRDGLAPGEVLYLLNNFIVDAFYRIGMYFTAVCCRLDLDTGELAYSSCAHPPIIVHRKGTGEFDVLNAQNTIVGFEEKFENDLEETRLHLDPGDKVVLYTDGIIEAEYEDDQALGVQGFVDQLRRKIDEAPGKLSEYILGQVNHFRQGPVRDDIYLIIAELKGGTS